MERLKARVYLKYEVYWSLLIYYKYFNRVFPFEKESASKLIGCVIQEKLPDSVQ